MAYQESRNLYDLSPEANFRLTQEVLLRKARYDDAYDIINELWKRDPNNARIPSMLEHINWVRSTRRDITRLQDQMKTGSLSTTGALKLAELHLEMRNMQGMMAVLNPLLQSKGNLPFPVAYRAAGILALAKKPTEAASLLDRAPLPANVSPDVLLSIVQVYAEARQPGKMEKPLALFLKHRPNDWKAWLDLATLHLMKKQVTEARTALQRALQLGGQEASAEVAKNPTLSQLLKVPAPRAGTLPRAPAPGPR
jgi:Flp pilus assembly protein TadD